MLSERDKTVLRDVARIAGSQDVAFYVIGAGARLLVYDWPNELIAGRGTTDWDIAVRVSSWVEYERLSRALTAEGASFKATSAEHRLVHADGRCLDLVPFGGVEGAGRIVTYPARGTTHSVLGLSECEACCVEVDIGEGVVVRAVEPPGLILLKARTYLDRRPAIQHDIRDLDYVVRT